MTRMTLPITRTVTVGAHERLLEYVDGRLLRVLPPGRHRRPRRATYRPVPTTERLATTSAQEIATADGVVVKATAAVRSAVVDPVAFVERAEDPDAVVYLAVQIALRDLLVEVAAEEVARMPRLAAGERLREAVAGPAREVGLEVRQVVLKDVVLPAELRSAYADQVAARARGLARLEAARAETAALRSLANGAKLLEEHPALARVRLVEALPYGSTVELDVR